MVANTYEGLAGVNNFEVEFSKLTDPVIINNSAAILSLQY
jgi:hypothetical protein